MSPAQTPVPPSASTSSSAESPPDESRPGAAGELLRRFWPFLAVAIFAAAIAVLHRELAAYRFADIRHSLRAVSPGALAGSVLITALAYAVLPGYDAAALRYVGSRLPLPRVAFGSFIAYAFSQTLGFPLLTGGSVRYRLWSAWGLSSVEIAEAVSFLSFSFALGMVEVSGIVFVLAPGDAAALLHLPFHSLFPIGVANLTLVAVYAIWSLRRRGPVTLGRWVLPSVSPRLLAAQLIVPALDWILAGAALYVLLPPGHGLSFPTFLGIFLLAQFAGLLSHVPGGLGVVETIIVLLLAPYLSPAAVLGPLLAYRGVYYLLPFGAGVVLLAVRELRPYTPKALGAARTLGNWAPGLLPPVLAGAVFLTGVILLVSGATPAIHSRLAFVGALLPVGVINASHFAGSVAGAGLLVLAWALSHRLDAAYSLTVALLAVGIGASLLKGADWEEATALAIVLVAMLPARRVFYRQASMFAERLEPGWLAAILVVVGASIWLGTFAHKHAQYRNDMWWSFALHADAPRFLRATVGAVGVLLVLGLARLLRHAPAKAPVPGPGELDHAAALVAEWPDVSASLALLGDKSLLFSESGRGMLMYGVAGRSWVALGDPVGPPAEQLELAWHFRELAQRHGGWTVFYEVGVAQLPLYIDLGLTLLKLGEEAMVPLAGFSLEGPARRALRRTQRQMERDGVTFEVVPPARVPPLLPELRAISDVWLREKHTREKGFSLGYFDEAYLSRFPLAVARQHGAVMAFANLWTSNTKTELSIDLMRHLSGAPGGVMQYLFSELMLWGKAQGYEHCSLGMAPLSGLDPRELAPLWSKVGAFLYRHGEHFYNFQGLREYKEKFGPVWQPRYLASPGGLALPRLLANVASLINGGLRGVVSK
jgi:phosphatidylglycerol lysyltransferase